MKKIIGIYFGGAQWGGKWNGTSVREKGAGGSETWAAEIASEFQKRGFHVIVFGNPECWHFDTDGVEYVPTDMFDHRCEYQHFDYFIFTRVIMPLKKKIKCNNIYLFAQDMWILDAFSYKDLKMDAVKKIGVISGYQKVNFKDYIYKGLDENQFFPTINGYDISLYNGFVNNDKENSMIWSSCRERGFDFFIDKIYPIIKQKVPDFKVYVCGYNETKYDNDNIIFLGKIGKQELSNLQKKCKIWIYPNYGITNNNLYFHETFCITAVENAMAGNAIVCLNAGGLSSTLEGYSGFIGEDLLKDIVINTDNYPIYFNIIEESNLNELSIRMAEQSIKILKDDNLRINLANECINICAKYTWANAANTWLKEWSEI